MNKTLEQLQRENEKTLRSRVMSSYDDEGHLTAETRKILLEAIAIAASTAETFKQHQPERIK